MDKPSDRKISLHGQETLHPKQTRLLRRIEVTSVVVGIVATAVQQGLRQITQELYWELGLVVIAAMLLLTVSTGIRYYWIRARSTFLKQNRTAIVFVLTWCLGIVAILILGPFLPVYEGRQLGRLEALLALSELLVILSGVAGVLSITRRAAAGGWEPALILVLTFVVLVVIGTALLMLPRAQAPDTQGEDDFADRFRIALFTATSASCVTGLVVEPTGGSEPYWSLFGQTIILCLFQLGGLGIMTCGSFFAVAIGSELQMRESAALRDLLESNALGDVRRMILAIVGFTFVTEVVGAFLLCGLWSHLPWHEQAYRSVFHSVSAFCNAGFSLEQDSFVAVQSYWQVWGAASLLIIMGGLGFAVLYNGGIVVGSKFKELRKPPLFNLPIIRMRLTLMSKLVLITTAALLLLGTLGYYLLESTSPQRGEDSDELLCEAWFQSVTFRTAGFNTVDHSDLQPATKLFAVALMFVGASPGSTGGGVKTVAFGLAILALISILRGRRRVEFFGRSIPDEQVKGALTIISLGMFAVITATLLLVLFENKPDRFIDHLFEAVSAFGTVGVSAIGTKNLTVPSQFVIIVTMFLGRVGTLTLLMALAGRSSDARYQFPEERVTLG